MSFLNMRFGVPRDSELMATEQKCGNWGLALDFQVKPRPSLICQLKETTLSGNTPFLIPRALTQTQ